MFALLKDINNALRTNVKTVSYASLGVQSIVVVTTKAIMEQSKDYKGDITYLDSIINEMK